MKYSFVVLVVAMIFGQGALAGGVGIRPTVKYPSTDDVSYEQGAVMRYLVEIDQRHHRDGAVFKATSVHIDELSNTMEKVTAFMEGGGTRYFLVRKNNDYGLHFAVEHELEGPPPAIVDPPEPGPKEHCRPGECWNTARSSSVK